MLAPLLGCAALAVSLILSAGCGDGGGEAADAAPVDAVAPVDAEDLCPGQLTMEGRVSDLETDVSQFEFAVRSTTEPAVATTSAPNGRAILCVDRAAEVDLTVSGDGSLDRTDRISALAMGRLRGVGTAYPFAMLSDTYAASLETTLAFAPPDGSSTLVVVQVVTLPDLAPLLGATVAIDAASDGTFSRQEGGTFVEGASIAAGGAVLIANVAVAPVPVVTIGLPDGFEGDCDGPSSLTPQPGAASGAVFVCAP